MPGLARAQAALVALRRAWQAWQSSRRRTTRHVPAPWSGGPVACLATRTRLHLNFQVARDTFSELGAQPDLTALEPLAAAKDTGDVHGIFAKLGVSSRTAATAFAYEHDLV